VICLEFVICDLEFFSHFNTPLLQQTLASGKDQLWGRLEAGHLDLDSLINYAAFFNWYGRIR
jgi:hypothetical protein